MTMTMTMTDMIEDAVPAPAADGDDRAERTIDEAQAELTMLEERAAVLRAEIAAGTAELEAGTVRANALRLWLADAHLKRAMTLRDQAEVPGGRTVPRLTDAEMKWVSVYAGSTLPLEDLVRGRQVSVNTAKTHLKNAYRKLKVKNRDELRAAVRRGALQRSVLQARIADVGGEGRSLAGGPAVSGSGGTLSVRHAAA